jgi:S-adenosylmethionine-dependent methyltransferase
VDDLSDVMDYYNHNLENEHTRLERHQLEHDLTWRFLKRYLPKQGSILEVGSATGIYTVELARQGYLVTAVDMSEALLDECRRRLNENGLETQVRLFLADVRDLNEISDRNFDAVLLMGPMYHLVAETDRKKALEEVYLRLIKGGVIFSAFISRYGVLGDLLKKMPDWIEAQVEVRSFLNVGKRPDQFPRGGFRGYFARAEEITPLHEAIGFQTILLAGVEPAISADDESYNSLEDLQRELWLNLFEEISTQESIIGASRHLLYIGSK